MTEKKETNESVDIDMKCVTDHFNFSLLLAIFSFAKYSTAVEADLTIDIEAGKRECFHQFVPTDSSFEVEYQVERLNYYYKNSNKRAKFVHLIFFVSLSKLSLVLV